MKEEAFIGYPINFQDICLVYPPKNKEIVAFGYQKFMVMTQLLTQTQDDIDDGLVDAKLDQNPTPFQQLFLQIALYPQMKPRIQEIFRLFVRADTTFLLDVPAIVVGDLKEKRMLTEENFFDFQNVVRAVIGNKMVEKPNPNENAKIKRFKALQRQRDRIKAKQNKGDAPKELLSLMTSACLMCPGITPINVGEITYMATKSLIDRFATKDQYETELASLLAGAKPDGKKQSYWIRDLEE